jgi:hypothetical protein
VRCVLKSKKICGGGRGVNNIPWSQSGGRTGSLFAPVIRKTVGSRFHLREPGGGDAGLGYTDFEARDVLFPSLESCVSPLFSNFGKLPRLSLVSVLMSDLV